MTMKNLDLQKSVKRNGLLLYIHFFDGVDHGNGDMALFVVDFKSGSAPYGY